MADPQLEKYRRIAKKLKNPTPVELPSGKFRCQVTVNGHRESVVDEDPRVAHAEALAIKASLLEAKKTPMSITLTDAIDQYVKSKSALLSPSTIRGYEIVKNNRFKSLMQMNAHQITLRDIQRAVNDETGLVSPKTIINAFGLVRPVLKDLGANIDFSRVKLPQRIKPVKKYLQKGDIGKIIVAAEGDPCEIPILMAVWLGMRRSEIIGLCWDCVDFAAGQIHVRRTYVPDKDNKWVNKQGAKNESSQRSISCPDYILEKLRPLQGKDEDRVFNIHPETMRRHVKEVCEKAGVTVTSVHGLRHTNAAVMRGIGVDEGHAMGRGGWADERTYKGTYSYVFDDSATESDQEIDRFFYDQIEKAKRKPSQDGGEK